MPKILYIMGTGRSGTTILEILLANNPGIVGLGEVTHIFQDGFMDNVTCSCGEPAIRCGLWAEIRKKCCWDDKHIPELAELFYDVAWHSNFPAVAMKLMPRKKILHYKNVNKCLFKAAQDVSDADSVVDSSKYAGRALALARAFPDKVRVLCLTRSPAGIISSFQKTDAEEQKPKSVISIFAYYLYVMICLRIVIWILGPQVMRVRYEEMTSDPQSTLSKIETWSGLDLSSVRTKLTGDEWLDVGHIVTGNRLRKKGRIRFRPGTVSADVRGNGARIAAFFMELCRMALGFK